jgi:hypothetical protein
MASLTEICSDVILNKLGEKPDNIQILVGHRALERLEKTAKQHAEKALYETVKREVSNEIGVLVTSMVRDIIRLGMGRDTPFYMAATYCTADKDLVERSWVIAKQVVSTADNAYFNLRYVV